ncbi:uncharacterized protein LACBIDRAFT_295321 [Laccaria bicolor S238N-H82]|uniref:Predicted protein n=1 Tax=Laccaria bicolor (strain S238N-H82 / ATCC MYA-4686) TaxID=486041 RepID=B0DQH2_LACBS|nr:uncharacterized protein LACBIDRAFT_295321 [Laccaria bicolor S238N-H82]EDR03109.1 predicted protein [Laccaria bicolor S238N-H82]|eukprot:XP_001886250.1 predicted protein [Laccaria bicolor S238N-H82]
MAVCPQPSPGHTLFSLRPSTRQKRAQRNTVTMRHLPRQVVSLNITSGTRYTTNFYRADSSSAPSNSFLELSSSSLTPSSTSEASNTASSTFQLLTDTVSTTQIPTTSSTTINTSQSGGTTIYASGLPTSLVSPPSRIAITHTAIIAGTVAGIIVFLLITFGAILTCQRRKRRKRRFIEEAAVRRRESKGLLDGEGFDDDDAAAMRAYRDGHRASSPTPSLIRSRASETGSIFREEVWPPPGEESRFVDPIERRSSQVDLSRIVNDVMGPPVMVSTHDRDGTYNSVSSAHSNSSTAPLMGSSSRQGFSPYNTLRSHPNSEIYSQALASDAPSSFPLSNSSTSLSSNSSRRGFAYTDPFQTQPPVTSTSTTSLPPGASPPISFYSPPPAAPKLPLASPKTPTPTIPPPQYIPPSQASANNVTLPIGSAPGTPPIPPPRSPARGTAQALPKPPPKVKSSPPNAYRPVGTSDVPISMRNTQPRKSSPLARALTQDAKIWLGRSPNRGNSPSDDPQS